MNKRRMMVVAYVSAFVILIILSLLFYDISGKTPQVILPTPYVSSALNSPRPGDNTGVGKNLEVTAENVQSVIATMKRQESYSERIMVTSFWSGGKAVYKISAFVGYGAYRLSVSTSSGAGKNMIISGDKLYVWYDGSRSYYIGNSGGETELYDKYEMIPTYEEILKLSKAEIFEASFKQYGDEPCIYVRAQSGNFGYIYEYYVSVNTGLLTAAFSYDKTTLIYSMTTDSVALTVPSVDMFKLPDGKSTVSS